jgi:hypothetical protein
MLTEPIEAAPDALPDVIADGYDVFVIQVKGIDQLPENIEL